MPPFVIQPSQGLTVVSSRPTFSALGGGSPSLHPPPYRVGSVFRRRSAPGLPFLLQMEHTSIYSRKPADMHTLSQYITKITNSSLMRNQPYFQLLYITNPAPTISNRFSALAGNQGSHLNIKNPGTLSQNGQNQPEYCILSPAANTWGPSSGAR